MALTTSSAASKSSPAFSIAAAATSVDVQLEPYVSTEPRVCSSPASVHSFRSARRSARLRTPPTPEAVPSKGLASISIISLGPPDTSASRQPTFTAPLGARATGPSIGSSAGSSAGSSTSARDETVDPKSSSDPGSMSTSSSAASSSSPSSCTTAALMTAPSARAASSRSECSVSSSIPSRPSVTMVRTRLPLNCTVNLPKVVEPESLGATQVFESVRATQAAWRMKAG